MDAGRQVTPLFELGSFGRIGAINNSEQVVGAIVTVPSTGGFDFTEGPFVWEGGTITLLPTLGGPGGAFDTEVSDINQLGW